MKYVVLTLLFFSSLISFAQNKTFKDYNFKELMTESKATFKMPRGFGEIPVTKKSAQFYQYAIRDTATGFEARYYIKPYHLHNEAAKDDSATYKSFVTIVSNISSSPHPDIQPVDPAHARADLHADYGLTSYFNPTSEFAPGYKSCVTMLIRKDNVGEIYIFMLFNTFDRETEIIIQDIIGSVDF